MYGEEKQKDSYNREILRSFPGVLVMVFMEGRGVLPHVRYCTF